jgi:hypothetical protein
MWAVLDTAQRNVRAFSTDWCRRHVHRHRERAPLPLGSQLVLATPSSIVKKQSSRFGFSAAICDPPRAWSRPAGLPAPQVDRGAWQDRPSWTRIFLAESGEEARDGEACCAGASGELMCQLVRRHSPVAFRPVCRGGGGGGGAGALRRGGETDSATLPC